VDVGSKIGFVYSAFLDTRITGYEMVRVFGYVRKNFGAALYCHLSFKAMPKSHDTGFDTIRSETVRVVRATLGLQWPDMVNFPRTYLAYFIVCPLFMAKIRDDSSPKEYPVIVSISTSSNATASHASKLGNNLLIHWHRNHTERSSTLYNTPEEGVVTEGQNFSSGTGITHQLAFCVKALRWVYRDIVQLVEFIELHAMFGVTRFDFYGHTYTRTVSEPQRGAQLCDFCYYR
jgi:hypothetical protein